MDSYVEIVFWTDMRGNSPPGDYFLSLPSETQAWIANRNDFIQKLTWAEFIRDRSLYSKVKGVSYTLYEVRYPGSRGNSYRMLSIRCGDSLVGLVIFKGSGSDSRLLRRQATIAIERAKDWRIRN